MRKCQPFCLRPRRGHDHTFCRSTRNEQDITMDAEHINQIGNTLQDLSERTQDLRRYL